MSNIKQYYLPAEDVNDEKATVVKLFFDSGDKVKKNDLIYIKGSRLMQLERVYK